jgi:hypothetical protein
MPIQSEITAISRSYPDIAVISDKYFFEKKLFILIGIFYLMASRSHRICFVAAHSQWTTTAGVRLYPHDEKRDSVLPSNISSRQSLTPSALHLRQPRLVNNPG